MIEENWLIKYVALPIIFGVIFGLIGIVVFIRSFFSDVQFWLGLVFMGISAILCIISFINYKIYKKEK